MKARVRIGVEWVHVRSMWGVYISTTINRVERRNYVLYTPDSAAAQQKAADLEANGR